MDINGCGHPYKTTLGEKYAFKSKKTAVPRILYTSTHYPANYGFIPRTFADDGDPLDVLVLCSEELLPLSLVRCYPIGVISMIDNGKYDEKIIAIPFSDPTYSGYRGVYTISPCCAS